MIKATQAEQPFRLSSTTIPGANVFLGKKSTQKAACSSSSALQKQTSSHIKGKVSLIKSVTRLQIFLSVVDHGQGKARNTHSHIFTIVLTRAGIQSPALKNKASEI